MTLTWRLRSHLFRSVCQLSASSRSQLRVTIDQFHAAVYSVYRMSLGIHTDVRLLKDEIQKISFCIIGSNLSIGLVSILGQLFSIYNFPKISG